jgi:DNA-binding response OmpR family regulator
LGKENDAAVCVNTLSHNAGVWQQAMQPYILLVDDNDDLADNLKLILGLEGIIVQIASDYTEALSALSDELPSLILADVRIPGASGYDFFRDVKAQPNWAGIPFVFLSALTSTEDVDRGLSLGANGYITKPFAIDDLLDVIHQYLR